MDTAEPTFDLGSNAFTRTLSTEYGAEFVRLLEWHRYEAGSTVLAEDDVAQVVYFVVSGTLEVRKLGEAGPVSLAVLGAGGMFGEMSFWDGAPASADVVAISDSWLALLRRDGLPADLASMPFYGHLADHVARVAVGRLRENTDRYVEALRAELEQERLRASFARFFIVMVVLFGVTNLLPRFLNASLESSSPALYMLVSWATLLVLLLPFAYFTTVQRQPLETFGVTSRGAARSLFEAIGIAALVAVPLLLYRASTIVPGEAFFSWRFQASFTRTHLIINALQYPFHSYLQEFIARGVVQGSLARFMIGSRPVVPILLTSCLFGIFHLYISLQFAVLLAVGSVVFGLIYHRHKNLLGVTLVHVALGLLTEAIGLN
jgi:membrane protease YdiL (CAAX protease family)